MTAFCDWICSITWQETLTTVFMAVVLSGLSLLAKLLFERLTYRNFRSFWKDFAIGPTTIVLSSTGEANGNRYTGMEDAFGAFEVQQILRKFNPKVDLRIISAQDALPSAIQDRHVVSVGGPSSNSVTKHFVNGSDALVEVLKQDGMAIGYKWMPENADYKPDVSTDQKTAKTDIGFIVMGPSPYLDTKRMVALFGIRGVGSWGAAKAISVDKAKLSKIWKAFKSSDDPFQAWVLDMKVNAISYPADIKILKHHHTKKQ